MALLWIGFGVRDSESDDCEMNKALHKITADESFIIPFLNIIAEKIKKNKKKSTSWRKTTHSNSKFMFYEQRLKEVWKPGANLILCCFLIRCAISYHIHGILSLCNKNHSKLNWNYGIKYIVCLWCGAYVLLSILLNYSISFFFFFLT